MPKVSDASYVCMIRWYPCRASFYLHGLASICSAPLDLVHHGRLYIWLNISRRLNWLSCRVVYMLRTLLMNVFANLLEVLRAYSCHLLAYHLCSGVQILRYKNLGPSVRPLAKIWIIMCCKSKTSVCHSVESTAGERVCRSAGGIVCIFLPFQPSQFCSADACWEIKTGPAGQNLNKCAASKSIK